MPAEAGIQCLFSTFDKGFQLSFDYDTASEAGIQPFSQPIDFKTKDTGPRLTPAVTSTGLFAVMWGFQSFFITLQGCDTKDKIRSSTPSKMPLIRYEPLSTIKGAAIEERSRSKPALAAT
jgi:hypothetical protein